MLEAGGANEATIINAASRLVEEETSTDITVPQTLVLGCEPLGNCEQYDLLRGGSHVSQ